MVNSGEFYGLVLLAAWIGFPVFQVVTKVVIYSSMYFSRGMYAQGLDVLMNTLTGLAVALMWPYETLKDTFHKMVQFGQMLDLVSEEEKKHADKGE